MACKNCGSYAINHHCHGRDGSDPDLCDVCYWRVRAERLRKIEAAAQNLLVVKGRHHTVEAYLRLEELM
jgi:hypothetical protein